MPIPNHYKYCTTKQTGCLKINNVCVAVDDSYEYGPTSTTGFWNGYIPFSNTSYTLNKVNSDNSSPSIIEMDNIINDDIIYYWYKVFTNLTFTSATECFLYAVTGATNNIINMGGSTPYNYFPSTITSGLTLYNSVLTRVSLPNIFPVASFGPRYWFDLSGNNFVSSFSSGANLSSRAYNGGVIYDGVDDNLVLPATSAIYSSNFTWMVLARYLNGTTAKYAFMWAETGATKNFGISYTDLNTSGTSMVIETSTTSYSATTSGTNYNGFSGKNGVQPSIRANNYVLTTLVKDGNEFRLYWDDAILKWVVNIPTWNIVNNTVPISFAATNNLTLASTVAIGEVRFYDRVLSTTEIALMFSGMTIGRYLI